MAVRSDRTLYIVANNYGASGASDGIVMIEQVQRCETPRAR